MFDFRNFFSISKNNDIYIYINTFGKNDIIYLKTLNMCKKKGNNVYDDVNSQQLHLRVDKNTRQRRKKRKKRCLLADDFQVSTVYVS